MWPRRRPRRSRRPRRRAIDATKNRLFTATSAL